MVRRLLIRIRASFIGLAVIRFILQDLNRLVGAWRKPDTVIVNEPWWTPTAQWADIVFPATTAQEREDLCASSHDNYAHFMQQVCGLQARSDHEIFAGLAAQLGFHDAFTEGRTEREWLQKLWQDCSRGQFSRALNCQISTNLSLLASTNYRQETVANTGSLISSRPQIATVSNALRKIRAVFATYREFRL